MEYLPLCLDPCLLPREVPRSCAAAATQVSVEHSSQIYQMCWTTGLGTTRWGKQIGQKERESLERSWKEWGQGGEAGATETHFLHPYVWPLSGPLILQVSSWPACLLFQKGPCSHLLPALPQPIIQAASSHWLKIEPGTQALLSVALPKTPIPSPGITLPIYCLCTFFSKLLRDSSLKAIERNLQTGGGILFWICMEGEKKKAGVVSRQSRWGAGQGQGETHRWGEAE